MALLPEQPAAASGAWTADDTFTAKICFYETPFIIKVNLKFSGDQLLFNSESNVGFGRVQTTTTGGKADIKLRLPTQIPRPASTSIS